MSHAKRPPVFDTTLASAQLVNGCAEMNLSVTPQQVEQLIAYVQLMAKWNPVYNLTAIRETDKMVSHHLLDSLAVLPLFEKILSEHTLSEETPKIMDVGTGGGLPGVVLSIMHPDWHITLIDPVHKKTAFLTQVKAQLSLSNVTVINGKVEDLEPTQTFDVITSRAFTSLVDFVQLSQNALAPNGCWLAMKGLAPEDEMQAFKQTFAQQYSITHITPVRVAQLNAERHLIQIEPISQKANTP